jgi:hypothetical protein
MTMKVRDAIAQLGIDPAQAPGELCIVQITKGGAKHYRYDEVADRNITTDLYLATGTFAPGSISIDGGRSADNLTSVFWLPADIDFKDYLNLPKAELHTWSDGDLMTTARALAQDVRELYELIGVPIHRIDYTGYGIAVYTYLNGHTTADIPTIRDLNRALVETINAQWGSTLADPGVHDAGTRIMRLVPGPNTKGETPRQAQTIYRAEGHVAVADLTRTLQTRTRTTVARAIPRIGTTLPENVVADLVNAIKPHWIDGQRHGVALALAGILAKAGITEDQAVEIVEQAAGNRNRVKDVESTYKRARAGLETRGLFGLRDWLPIETVEFIDRTLDEVRPRNADITFTASDGVAYDNTPEDMPVLPIPEVVKTGLIGEYIALMRPTTEASESYHLGVGLTIVSAMIGRNIFVDYGSQVYPNLYTLLVGVSGKSRKDTAIKRGTRLLTSTATNGTTQLRSNVKIVTDVASAEGLIGSLSEHNNILLYLTEFSRLVSNARRKGTTTILPVLMEAFDTPAVLSNLSKANPLNAEMPYLTILSATQPRILEGLMSDEDVHSGFINRWLIIPGKSEAPIAWPVSVDQQAALILFEQMHAAIHSAYPVGFAMELAEDARSFWEDWYEADWKRKQAPDEEAMRARYSTLIIKLALIYAVLNGDQVITRDNLERGIAFIDWMWAHVARMVPGWGSTLHGQLEHRIVQVLKEQGPMKQWRLSQLVSNKRKWSATDIKAMRDALVSTGVIAIDAAGVVGLRND